VGFRLLVYGDLHLRPGEPEHGFERPDLDAASVDAVVTLGDVVDENVDRAGRSARRHERRARAFFEHLDDADVPVVAVPGDHDPVEATERLTGGLDTTVVAHERALGARELPGDVDLDGASLAGIGCEERAPGMALPYMTFDTIDPRSNTTARTIGWVADDAADQVEAAVGGFLARDHGVGDVADELGVQGSARERLANHLASLRSAFLIRRSLLAAVEGPTVLLSHRSPFNTALDYHEEFDDLDDRLHRGSLALKMAVATTAPMLTLCGHVHRRGHDTVETVRGDRIAFSPGHRGVALVDVDPSARSVDVHADPF
jgi:Icc-related predicted phosphoesterase